jgi:cell division protein FtsI/penicillin-binding protein 2
MTIRRSYPVRWREYQDSLHQTDRRKRVRARLYRWAAAALVATGLTMLILAGLPREPRQPVKKPAAATGRPAPPQSWTLPPPELTGFIGRQIMGHPEQADQFQVETDNAPLKVRTTIDPRLQVFIDRLLRRSRTVQAAVVVMDPFDGRVLAMVSRDAGGQTANLCLQSEFPAASLFKIVSAAAVLEDAGYGPDQTLFFDGRRHTLYKNQLQNTQGRYTTRTSLRKAFAASNNSVFGKLGIYALGRDTLGEYADRFLFNRTIPFDLPVTVSTLPLPQDDYGLAEIASGFNKRTLMSPLHAAMLSAAVVNSGRIQRPQLVAAIAEPADNLIYQARDSVLATAVEPATAAQLKLLMQDVVRYGTTRKAFSRLRRHTLLQNLELGAKTGSINDRGDRFRYDWITAFALAPDRSAGICLGIVMVHGEKLGTRATELGRAIIEYYFLS